MKGSYDRAWQVFLAIALVVTLFVLSLYNLEYYPLTGFDEGIHLLVAKRLALEGHYRFGPAVGPTVFFPIAIAFRLAGVGLLPARIAMVGYLLLCVATFYLLTRFLGGWKVATVGTWLLLSSSGPNLWRWGRQALGEVPATFFSLVSIFVWLKALEQQRKRRKTGQLLLTGVLAGLAVVTKNQFLLLLPAWFLLWIVDRLYYRRANHVDFALPFLAAILVVVAWYLGQRFFFPAGEYLAEHNLQEWSSALSRGIFTLSPRRMVDAIKFLTGKDAFYAWVLPGCLYGVVLSLRRSEDGLRWALPVILSLVWLGWYIILSVGWPRYVFLPLTLGAIFVARLFHDLTEGYRIPFSRLVTMIRSGRWDGALAGRVALMAVLLIIILRPLQGRFLEVVTGSGDAPQRMASYIEENLPEDAEIETYDPEICFLSGFDCHLPPSFIMDASIRYAWYGAPPPSEYYDFRDYEAPYLLIGDFSRWVQLYDPEVVERDYELCIAIEGYELYRLR
jgi:hypothetical protein